MSAAVPVAPLTTIHGVRIVASPSALDEVVWPPDTIVVRFAPDDVFVVGGDSIPSRSGIVSDEHAIIAAESGFVGCWLNAATLAHVASHIDWPLPTQRPAIAQGFIAGVPAKLHLTRDTGNSDSGNSDQALLLTNAPYANELWERLS